MAWVSTGQRKTIAGAGDPKAVEKVPCQATNPKLPGAKFPPTAWRSVCVFAIVN